MKKSFALIAIFLIGIIYAGCSDNSTDPGNSQSKGGVQFKIDKANAPADVTTVEAIMISEAGDSLIAEMDMKSDTTAEISFMDIAVGKWYLTVNAYNIDGALLYTGSKEIEIKAGILVQISLVLQPVQNQTGSVQIEVTWGSSLTKTLILQPGPEEAKDAMLSSIHPDWNYGVDYPDFVLYNGLNYDTPHKYRTIIEFDLSSIPKNAKIKSAALELFYNSTSGICGGGQQHAGDDNSFSIMRVTEEWDETTVTWHNTPDYDSSEPVYVPPSEYGTQDYNIDVTSLVQTSVNYPENSHGFLLKLNYETPYVFEIVMLYTSDIDFADKRPKLTIKYE